MLQLTPQRRRPHSHQTAGAYIRVDGSGDSTHVLSRNRSGSSTHAGARVPVLPRHVLHHRRNQRVPLRVRQRHPLRQGRGFLDCGENVILLGPPGAGKTHLAISLAIAAAEASRRVYYGTLAGLIDSLMDAKAAGELSRRLRVLTHPALLVVDEIGYLPVSQDGAVLFFQLINARHERASTVLTSNKGFEEWGSVLGDEVMAAALIDRLLHHCHIVNIRGNSYRMREHQHWLRSASEERREGVAK